MTLSHRRFLKEPYTQKRKISAAMKILEGVNLTRWVDKQIRTRKESNIAETTKWLDCYISFNNNSEC
jgi:hypothetical protein